MPVIRTFLFDMGNVLVHFSHEQMCAQIAAVSGGDVEWIRAFLFDSGLQIEFESGKLSEAEFHALLERHVERTIDIDELRFAASDIFELNAPLLPILNALKSRGHRLVLLSNTSFSHFEFIRRRFDVLDQFDDFVLSYEVGALKPASAIFESALQKIDCEPSECFYTDDIVEYVEMARTFGIHAETFVDAETLVSHLQRHGIVFDESS